MKTIKTLSTIIGLASICFASRAQITVLDMIQNPANGHNYYLLSAASWTDSEAFAQTLGGNLVTINDAAENTWVANTFYPLVGDSGSLWIGYYDPSQDLGGGTHASNFVWVDGETPGYTDWYTGEPNDTGGVEFYTAMRPDVYTPYGSWNDLANNFGPAYGVVEVVPEPQSLTLIALGAGVLMVVRRKKS
jgi:Lectin C-type domain/PEP-CTERM motif